MIAKVFAALALVSAPADSPSVSFLQYPQVRQVICDEGRGTAFQTGQGWVSVAHVTRLGHCTIDGHQITVTEQDGDQDFSRIETDVPRWLPSAISCEGFKPGQYYWATGYAMGKPFQTNIRVMGTGLHHISGMAMLVGEYSVIPGMSGGEIFDQQGRVVGTVNAYLVGTGISFSRELKGTSLCR